MLMKRKYRKPAGWTPEYNVPGENGRLPNPHRAAGVLLNPPPLDHVEVLHTGMSEEQNFSTRLVDRGISEGWIAVRDGKLVVYGKPENLEYDILKLPGRYSCFDGSKLPDDADDTGRQAREIIASRYPGQPSPDPNHPAGYYKINHYECKLNAAQQERFRLRKGKR